MTWKHVIVMADITARSRYEPCIVLRRRWLLLQVSDDLSLLRPAASAWKVLLHWVMFSSFYLVN